MKQSIRALYFIAGSLSLILAVIGFLLPIVPGGPFVVIAAYCFSRSSKTVHEWLLRLPYIGRLTREWEELRVVPWYFPWIITACMIASTVSFVLLTDIPRWAHIAFGVLALLLSVLTFVRFKTNGKRR